MEGINKKVRRDLGRNLDLFLSCSTASWILNAIKTLWLISKLYLVFGNEISLSFVRKKKVSCVSSHARDTDQTTCQEVFTGGLALFSSDG